jgi:5-methyltetrahydrofolate--homocysteine methyltransferase
MLIAADAFYAGYKVVLPHLGKAEIGKGSVVMGVVAGDIHTIGKDIVIPVMESEGFEVVDLGIDVSASKFAQKVRETGARFVFISSFLSETTYVEVPKVIEEIKKAGIRDKVKIFIGGPATTKDYADKVGADGWGKDAWEAVKLVRRYF